MQRTSNTGPAAVHAPDATLEVAVAAGGLRSPRVVMIGAGQLARMTHQAAISLALDFTVVAASADDAAVRAGAPWRRADPNAYAELEAAVAGADVVTFDHERIPPEHLQQLAAGGYNLQPKPAAKLFAQDKAHQRGELARLGFPVPEFAVVADAASARAFARRHGWPLVAKPPRGGYDGRGVFVVADETELERLLGEQGTLLLEARLDLVAELAVLTARSTNGEAVVYPVVETVQVDGMCREIIVPARVSDAQRTEAQQLALAISEAIGATGVVALELFCTRAGLLVNELALRPHNSGHYTIEGCVTSQFEQHLRAVVGWPLGSTELVAPAVATVNVVGPPDGSDPRAALPHALATVRDVHVHLYGKGPRPGRKLGHVTVLAANPDEALARARRAAAVLEGRAQ